jgi:hypothetical protein
MSTFKFGEWLTGLVLVNLALLLLSPFAFRGVCFQAVVLDHIDMAGLLLARGTDPNANVR